jgi:hypothetical protein
MALALVAVGAVALWDTLPVSAQTTAGVDALVQEGSEGAVAFFRSQDAAGCVLTGVFVVAEVDDERILPSSTSRTTQVALVISQFDVCAVVPILTGNGVATDGVVTVAPNLSSASVSAVVPVLNLANGQLVNVLVDLSFVGTSRIDAENGLEQNTGIPDYRINTTFHQTFRAAIATGTVSTGIGNLTPEPSVEAQIDQLRVGTVVIQRP